MAKVIHPQQAPSITASWSSPTPLPDTLSPAEQRALSFFEEFLDDSWEIYVHPHLNGTRPDFLLLNPRTGIGLIEVRDWNNSTLPAAGDSAMKLALGKLRNAKNEIFDLYCPTLGMKSHSVWRAKSAIHCILLCPFASHSSLAAAAEPCLSEREQNNSSIKLLGREHIKSGNLYAACPELRYTGFMTAEAAESLRPWIDGSGLAIGNDPLNLNPSKQNIARSPITSGYRRIRGAAGSGKTLVIAARAAWLANNGRRVLVIPFNIMLVSLLHRLISRDIRHGSFMNLVTCLHFHEWCRRICITYDDDAYRSIFADRETGRQDKLNEHVPALALTLLRKNKDMEQIYDAVLVDEGQDFRFEWWSMLREACRPDGEMMLAADRRQDIYGNAGTWLEENMRNAGFHGRWITLPGSPRCPERLETMARHFAREFLPQYQDEPFVPFQKDLAMANDVFRWVQCRPETASFFCRGAVLDMIMDCSGDGGMEHADVTLLSQHKEPGRQVVQMLRALGLSGEDTFSEDGEESKRAKRRFGEKKYAFKASTIHGFKGWEATRIVLYIQGLNRPEDKSLVYVGLSRLLQDNARGSHLTVVCSAPELRDFGRREFGTDFRNADTDMGLFLESFLAAQFFAFKNMLPNLYGYTLCTLKRFSFQGCFPDYKNLLHRNFYFLKYSIAYVIEYREMYRRILASGRLRETSSPVVLSIGCGAMLDLVGLTYELREREGRADPVYCGVDLVDWKCNDTNIVPNQNLMVIDVGRFSKQKGHIPPIDIIFFPKSISEIPETALDSFIDSLSPSDIAERAVVAISKRGRASEDHDAALHLCRRLCEKLDFVMVHSDDTVFSDKSPQKFTQLLPRKESRERVDYYLDRAAEEMERLYNRFLDCDCPEVEQCMSIAGRQPMRNLTKANGVNAEPEIYYFERKDVS